YSAARVADTGRGTRRRVAVVTQRAIAQRHALGTRGAHSVAHTRALADGGGRAAHGPRGRDLAGGVATRSGDAVRGTLVALLPERGIDHAVAAGARDRDRDRPERAGCAGIRELECEGALRLAAAGERDVEAGLLAGVHAADDVRGETELQARRQPTDRRETNGDRTGGGRRDGVDHGRAQDGPNVVDVEPPR